MDDDSAEIELVCFSSRRIHEVLTVLSARAEPQQNTPDLTADDLCVICSRIQPLTILHDTVTAILTNFDTRLVKLEKSILPLYNSTQKLKQRAHSWSPVQIASQTKSHRVIYRHRSCSAEDRRGC
jgi:hypothetical protein